LGLEKRSEKEKMLSGEIYNAADAELVREREHARRLTRLLNGTLETEHERRGVLLRELFGSTGCKPYVEPPFYCDYGYNIHVGDNFFANFDCVILDVCEVRISLFSKSNYIKQKNQLVGLLLQADFTITDRRYLGFEYDTSYHHYAIDVAKDYEMEG
jgi:hypothetical protein